MLAETTANLEAGYRITPTARQEVAPELSIVRVP